MPVVGTAERCGQALNSAAVDCSESTVEATAASSTAKEQTAGDGARSIDSGDRGAY
jgi:hypothetical protein